MIWGHLSREDVVALVDRGDWDHPHLAACERCRRDVDQLRALVEELRAVPVPEPSPLFWDHMTRRVREAIEAEPSARADLRPRWWALVPATLAVAAAVGALWWTLPSQPAAPYAVADSRVVAAGFPDLDLDAGAEASDESWDVVLTLAEDVDWENGPAASGEEAGGVGGAWSAAIGLANVERALLGLSDDERAAVRELLVEELEAGLAAPAAKAPQG